MKLIFAGSQGTGKSTLNKQLQNLLSNDNIKIIDSMSEKFFKKEDLRDLYSINFLEAQLRIFAYASNEYLNSTDYISSRGFADSFAYCKHVLDKGIHIDAMNSIMDLAVENHKILKNMGAIYVYVPIEFPIESKELRSSSTEFQKEIDCSIKHFLDMTNTEYCTVHGSTEKRVDTILQYIHKRGLL